MMLDLIECGQSSWENAFSEHEDVDLNEKKKEEKRQRRIAKKLLKSAGKAKGETAEELRAQAEGAKAKAKKLNDEGKAAKGVVQHPGGRGMYPMSMKGATAATRGLMAEDSLTDKPKGSLGTEAQRRDLETRESKILEVWLETCHGVLALTREDLRRQIRSRIHRIYGLDTRYTQLRQDMDP